MNEKRLAQIKARKKEIGAELRSATLEDVEKLNHETDELIKEEQELREKLDLNGKLGDPLEKPSHRADTNEYEKRGKALRGNDSVRVNDLSLSDIQQRATTIGGGDLVKPMDNQTLINAMMGVGTSLVDFVKATNCYGMSEYQVPYEVQEAEATHTEEAQDAGETDPKYKFVSIKPYKLTTYSLVTREVMKLTDVDYFSHVQAAAHKALRKKTSRLIVTSDGLAQSIFVGLVNAPAISGTYDLALSGIDAKTLRTIYLHYGTEEDVIGNGMLLLSKDDLIKFGDVRGTNEKKALYEIVPDATNPNIGTIKEGGVAVKYSLTNTVPSLDDAAADEVSMIYGVPTCYELGLFSDYEVRVSEDYEFRKGMLAVLGEVMVGGNVVVKDGFVRVKKSA